MSDVSDVERLAEAMAEVMNGGMWSSSKHYNGEQKSVWEGYAAQVLEKLDGPRYVPVKGKVTVSRESKHLIPDENGAWVWMPHNLVKHDD